MIFDFDRMLADCLPGGSSCDPQQVADAIRAWFASQPQPASHTWTGNPPGLLQDDSREPSRALASKPDAMRHAREAAAAITPAAQPADPLDTPLPCDVKIGGGTHCKGTPLRTLVIRAQRLWDEAYGPMPSPEQQARNLAALQACAKAKPSGGSQG